MSDFQNEGYVILPQILTGVMCERISSSLTKLLINGVGSRSLLEAPWCAELAQTIRQHPAIAPHLPADAVAVQCTFFEKSKDQNWLVPIHQDLSIPVKEKIDDLTLTGWSEKEGTVFVQPPDTVLQALVAVRLHVDDCGLDDGALRVVPGSHELGRLSHEDALKARSELGEVFCPVQKGGALLMKPLALHASAKATGYGRRRVLHIVFGPSSLPLGLRWKHVV